MRLAFDQIQIYFFFIFLLRIFFSRKKFQYCLSSAACHQTLCCAVSKDETGRFEKKIFSADAMLFLFAAEAYVGILRRRIELTETALLPRSIHENEKKRLRTSRDIKVRTADPIFTHKK